jgi:hypothetical protein
VTSPMPGRFAGRSSHASIHHSRRGARIAETAWSSASPSVARRPVSASGAALPFRGAGGRERSTRRNKRFPISVCDSFRPWYRGPGIPDIAWRRFGNDEEWNRSGRDGQWQRHRAGGTASRIRSERRRRFRGCKHEDSFTGELALYRAPAHPGGRSAPSARISR